MPGYNQKKMASAEEDSCISCGGGFSKRAKGYNRYSTTSKLRGTDLSPIDVSSETMGCKLLITPTKPRFMCDTCTNKARQVASSMTKSKIATSDLKASATGSYLKRKIAQSNVTPSSTPLCTPRKKGTLSLHQSKRIHILHQNLVCPSPNQRVTWYPKIGTPRHSVSYNKGIKLLTRPSRA